jgi:hypothetical protein
LDKERFAGLKNHQHLGIILILFICAACSTSGPAVPEPENLLGSALEPEGMPVPDVTVSAVGGDYATIQAAVDDPAVVSGNIIGVSNSPHTEQGITVSKDIVIQGLGPDSTIVQADKYAGEASERVFHIKEGANVTIRNITVRYGNTTECPNTGGGIFNEGALVLENCVVTKNSSSSGGGITTKGSLIIINSTISDNVADGRGGDRTRGSGGGIKSAAGPVAIIGSTICNNHTMFRGGGIKLGCISVLDLVNTAVLENTAVRNGGGIHLKGTVNITGCIISGNKAGDGGGILNEGILNISNTIITGNFTDLEYGTADLLTGDEGTVEIDVNNRIPDF